LGSWSPSMLRSWRPLWLVLQLLWLLSCGQSYKQMGISCHTKRRSSAQHQACRDYQPAHSLPSSGSCLVLLGTTGRSLHCDQSLGVLHQTPPETLTMAPKPIRISRRPSAPCLQGKNDCRNSGCHEHHADISHWLRLREFVEYTRAKVKLTRFRDCHFMFDGLFLTCVVNKASRSHPCR